MNWWRRNWVDALMIALILGVVGGFAALLLRGSPLSVANPSPPGSQVNPVVSPPAPAPSPSAANPAVATPPPASPQVIVKPPAKPPSPVVVTPKPPASPATPPVVSGKPPPPVAKPTPSEKPKPTAQAITSTPPAGTTKPASSATTRPAPSVKKPEPGSGLGGNGPSAPTVMAAKPIKQTPRPARPTAINPPALVKPAPGTSRSQFLRSYRVAVGSFSAASRANSAAASLRARGLPAVAVASGNVMVVVVGPYSSESAARAALNRVQSSYPDAILYRPDGSRSRARGASTVAPSPTPSEPQRATQDTNTTVTATDEGAYLQVAAFRNSAGATPLLTQLRGSGYPAFLRSSPDGLMRVLVGPLSQDALRRARTDLRRRGHQPFTVTK